VRLVGDQAIAEEITQSGFVTLAQSAGMFAQTVQPGSPTVSDGTDMAVGYELTVTKRGMGDVTVDPAQAIYAPGTVESGNR